MQYCVMCGAVHHLSYHPTNETRWGDSQNIKLPRSSSAHSGKSTNKCIFCGWVDDEGTPLEFRMVLFLKSEMNKNGLVIYNKMCWMNEM